MTRKASQFTFCSPHQILRQAVVEQNAFNVITAIFSLDSSNVEPDHTLFLDGIISIEIISLSKNTRTENISALISDYQYIYLGDTTPSHEISPTKKNLLLDFGSDDYEEINKKISLINKYLFHFSVFDIIAACTYYPALILKMSNTLEVNYCSRLVLWENIDLQNKQITHQTRIRKI